MGMLKKAAILKRSILVILIISLLLLLIPPSVQGQTPSEKGPYATALVYGYIYNITSDGTLDELDDYIITITREDFIPRTNESDRDGYYEIWVPPSREPYTIRVKDEDGKTVRSKTIYINTSDPYEFDVEVSMDEDEEDDEKTLRDYGDDVWKFIKRGWIFIIMGIALLFIAFIVLAGIYGAFERIQASDKFPKDIVIIIKRFLMLFITFGALAGEYLIIHFLFDLPSGALIVAIRVIVAVFLVIILFSIMRATLLVLNKIILYYRKKFEAKDENLIYSRALLILEFIIKYILILTFVIVMIIALMMAFGFEDLVFAKVGEFFLSKFGFIILLGFLIIIAISVQKFSRSFFEDLRKRPGTKKLSPGLMFILEKSIKVGLYVILGVMAVFTLLSAMGLGDLGQTIILMLSMIVGFVISMAATGSIGNALSGLVLYGFKPIEKGDRVTLTLSGGDSFTGDVENIDLMFTTVRDLEDQVVKVPNNIVMGHNLINHTKSEKPGFAVVVDVTLGYDVPAEKAKDLMRTSALETPGVLEDPKPSVLLTHFHNHAIEYRLRGFINNAKAMYPIRSGIMRNMQKNFAQHGIEILSPLYHIKREEPKPTREDITKVFTAVEEADKNRDSFSMDLGATAAFEGLATMEVMDQVCDEMTEQTKQKKKKVGQPPPPKPEPKKGK